MDKATHSLTLCERTCALRRGVVLGRSLSHSIPYQFTAAAESHTRHVSTPENDLQRRRTRRNASPALQSRSRQTQLKGEGQIFPPLNSRATSRTQTWSRASGLSPDSALIYLTLPRTRDMFLKALRISLQHSGETSRTQT